MTASFGTSVIPTVQALDFRLHEISVEEDGFSHIHFYFQGNAGTNISIDMPQGWISSSSEGSITTSPRDSTTSQIKVEKSPLPPTLAFKDQGLDTYRRYVSGAVPQGAVNIRIVEEKDSLLPVFNWKDYQIVVSYDLFAQSFKRSLIFINLNTKEQIIVTAVASKDNYDAVCKSALEMMRSWSPMTAK